MRRYATVALCLLAQSVWAGSASLSWTAPTQNEDGTPLTDLAGYRIYSGCNQSGQYERPVIQIDATATSYVVSGLPDAGSCYFVGTAFNSAGVESVYSNEAVKSFAVPGTTTIAVTWRESVGMGRTVVATDNFNRASLGTTDWAQLSTVSGGSMTIYASVRVDGSAAQPPSDAAAARWIGAGTITDDQYAKISIVSLAFISTSYHIGVICRASADTDSTRDYYYATVAGDSGGPNYTTSLGKIVNGTNTTLHSAAAAWSAGDTIELECEGTTIRLMKNGTALGGSFTQTDTSLSTGNFGIIGAGADNVAGDDWEGGNLAAASTATSDPWHEIERGMLAAQGAGMGGRLVE